MPRVTRGNKKLLRRKKILDRAKGFWGAKRKNYRSAKEAVEKALTYALADDFAYEFSVFEVSALKRRLEVDVSV